jgi:hypothetical protein
LAEENPEADGAVYRKEEMKPNIYVATSRSTFSSLNLLTIYLDELAFGHS